jgi:hypothetical protein
MAQSISEGTAQDVFHATLGAIWSAVLEKKEPTWKGYLDERSTDKRWFDDVEWVDGGLWAETEEGGEIDLDEFGQGYVTRYRPMKFAKRLVIPNEIVEDAAYEEAYDHAAEMGRTFVQTQNYYSVGIIDDAADTNIVGGDGVTLANSAHPIKGGSTISNILDPALSPSNTSVQLVLVACEKMNGSNGYRTGQKVEKYFGPSNLKFRFKEILKSEKRDDTSNNALNALKGEGGDSYHSVPEMASTTNWFAKTDAPRGAAFVWRRKARFDTAAEIKVDSKVHVGSARFLVSYSNWRWMFASLA